MGCVHSKPRQRESRQGVLCCSFKGNSRGSTTSLTELLEWEETGQMSSLGIAHQLEELKARLADKEAEIQHLQDSLECQEAKKAELRGQVSDLQAILATAEQTVREQIIYLESQAAQRQQVVEKDTTVLDGQLSRLVAVYELKQKNERKEFLEQVQEQGTKQTELLNQLSRLQATLATAEQKQKDQQKELIKKSVEILELQKSLEQQPNSVIIQTQDLAAVDRLTMEENAPSEQPSQEVEVHLKDLDYELQGVQEWFRFGLNLEIPEAKLLEIRENNRGVIGKCRLEMLIVWGKRDERTWSKVVRSLQAIKMTKLAKDLATKYGVSLTSTVDDKALQTVAQKRDMPFGAQLLASVRQLSEEVETQDQHLSDIATSLEQEKKSKYAASRKHYCIKRSLSSCHSNVTKLQLERKRVAQQLNGKKLELHYLQLLLEQQQEENEELKTVIKNKEVEIRQLQDTLERLDGDLHCARLESNTLREELQLATKELEVKCVQVQELERTRADLMTILECERKRVDQLLMQSAAIGMGDFVKEVKWQLASLKEQSGSQSRDTNMVSRQQAVTRKEEEIRRLSEEVQTLEAQLQEVLQTYSREDEVEEKLHRLTVDTSDLRVQLAEAEGEKLEAMRQLEGILREKSEMKQWIAELEKKGTADPQKCTAVGSGVEVAETAQVARFEVHLADADGDPCTATQNVTAELTSIASSSVIEARVVDKTPATYDVFYQPSVRGRHDLIVRVNGILIHGSPFRVYVRHPPRLLGNPVRVIGGLNGPYRIVTTRNGGMFILCERNGVSVYSKDGQKIRTIESVRSGIRSYKLDPYGVAVDGSGNMYITDCEWDRLFKLNSDGKLVKSVGGEGKKPGQFSWPDGIAISTVSKLFVCDRGNNRIQIFDTNLNFINCFGTKGRGEGEFHYPCDIAIDGAGNLYVADQNNHCIQVLSQRGTFLRTFGRSGSRPGELSVPQGIHVDHDWVYVTEYFNRRVSVFTTSGEFITSFGNHGRGEEEFTHPRGITIDEEGYVYVCDNNNHRIQVF